MSHRATERSARVGQEVEGIRGKLRLEPLLQFPWKRQGKVCRFRIRLV